MKKYGNIATFSSALWVNWSAYAIALFEMERYRDAAAAWDQALAPSGMEYQHVWAMGRTLTLGRAAGHDSSPAFRASYKYAMDEADTILRNMVLSANHSYFIAMLYSFASAAA